VSFRKGDDSLLDILRDLQRRVHQLETQQNSARRNDVRIGDLLISWNGTTNQVTFSNLATNGPLVTINVP
jgi:hypothetical protein